MRLKPSGLRRFSDAEHRVLSLPGNKDHTVIAWKRWRTQSHNHRALAAVRKLADEGYVEILSENYEEFDRSEQKPQIITRRHTVVFRLTTKVPWVNG